MNAPDEISQAFDQFVAAFRAGDGDPSPFLDRFQGDERRELETLVDAFLESGPRADVDLSAAKDPRLEAIAESVLARTGGASGGLSGMVRDLREELLLKQSDVVGALAGDLAANEQETEKIDAYYHDLEWGTLPAAGIKDQLLDSLAGVLKTSREKLRAAGRALGPSGASAAGPVFARMADDAEFEVESVASMDLQAPTGQARRSDPPDRIDELFTGNG